MESVQPDELRMSNTVHCTLCTLQRQRPHYERLFRQTLRSVTLRRIHRCNALNAEWVRSCPVTNWPVLVRCSLSNTNTVHLYNTKSWVYLRFQCSDTVKLLTRGVRKTEIRVADWFRFSQPNLTEPSIDFNTNIKHLYRIIACLRC